jgi:hypothetical protein
MALSAGVFIVPGKIGNCRFRRRALLDRRDRRRAESHH